MQRLFYASTPFLLEKTPPFTLFAGLALTPFVALIEKYVFADWQFVGFLLVLVVVDTAIGLLRAIHLREVNSRAFSRLFTKALCYLSLLILAHVMTTFPIKGEPNAFFKWFDYFIYSAMMAREALSILEHVADIEPSLVPTWLLRRLKQFNEEGPAVGAPAPLLAAPAPLAEAVAIPSSPIEEEVQ